MLNTFPYFTAPSARQAMLELFTKAALLLQRAPRTPKRQRAGLHFVRYLMDSWVGALLGGGVYGAWAVWANWAQGAQLAFTIGGAHWATSALLTYFGTMAMRRFYGASASQWGSLRAFLGGLALTYASLFAVHGLLGTQQLLLTLAPGILPNILFCGSYALLLKRTRT